MACALEISKRITVIPTVQLLCSVRIYSGVGIAQSV
jgi:hypothetical protein